MSDTHAKPPAARLALEDGTVFAGIAFGDTAPQCVEGEVCFNTGLAGYQEVLTDLSYAGQIITMTYPHIGNYGVNEDDMESTGIAAKGLIVRELTSTPSNFRSEHPLSEWMQSQGKPGIANIDTRALTRKLRVTGALKGVLCTDPRKSDEELVKMAVNSAGLVGRNLVAEVSRSDAMDWSQRLGNWAPLQGNVPPVEQRRKVVALDCGAKLNIFRSLADSGCDVTVMPWDTPPEAIMEQSPDGLFLSNGPGDPAAVEPTVSHLKKLHGKLPIFGICLGHQLLSLSLGATTFKLKFGHRGANQPVQNLHTEKVEITSQNHGFAVDADSLKSAGGEPTHMNLNDQTLEGFRHREMPIFAVQYHPEASPGPHDARYLFDCFMDMMDTGRPPTGEQMDAAQRRRNTIEARRPDVPVST